MLSLAFDTSGRYCAAAVHRGADDAILAESSMDIGRGHAELLMDVIAATLAQADLAYADVGRIIATAGPGSFTGVRIGLAAARGFALSLSVPAIGVNMLEALKLTAPKTKSSAPLLVVTDARRGEAYCQHFGSNSPLWRGPESPFVADYEALAEMAQSLLSERLSVCGSGSAALNRMFEQKGRPTAPVLHELDVAPIAAVARVGAAMPITGKPPEPIYLRSADAKPQTGFALERT